MADATGLNSSFLIKPVVVRPEFDGSLPIPVVHRRKYPQNCVDDKSNCVHQCVSAADLRQQVRLVAHSEHPKSLQEYREVTTVIQVAQIVS